MFLQKKSQQQRILPEFYRWEFIHPIERNATGHEVPLPIPTPDLPHTNETVYTFWAHTISPFFYNGVEIGSKITFVTPTTYEVTYHIVNETYDYVLDGETFTVDPGGMKVEFFIKNWEFRNPNNSLEFPLSIASTVGMHDCELSRHNHLQDKFHCKGDTVDFVEYAQSFALINNNTRVPMNYKMEHKEFPTISSSSSDTSKCDDEPVLSLQEALFIGTVPAYEGVLFYDPDVSLLLGGRENPSGCDDDQEDYVVVWLSISFAGAAIIISVLLVAVVLHVPPIRRLVFGAEFDRIRTVRIERKRFSKYTDSWTTHSQLDDATAL